MDCEPMELTTDTRQCILGLVRSGTFPRVAVECAGIPWADFRRWQTQERRAGRGQHVREFRIAIRQAAAQSRAKAELTVREKSPLLWLIHGPGRDRSGNPGWANPAKPSSEEKKGTASGGLESPRTQAVLELVLEVLRQFPEAQATVAAVLDRAGGEPATPAGGLHNRSSTVETPAADPTDGANPSRA